MSADQPPGPEASPPPGAPGPGTPEPPTPGSGDRRDRSAERRRRRVRRRRWILGVAAGLLVVVVAVVAWYEIEAHPSGPPGPAVIVHVAKGEGSDAVAGDLAAHGVVASSLAFRLSFLINGTPTITPGDYQFHENLSFSAAREVLDAGPNVFAVDVLPGYTLREVADAVEDLPGMRGSSFLALANSGTVRSPFQPAGVTTLEGLVGTGTYEVVDGESERQLLSVMVERFTRQALAAGVTPAAAAKLGVSTYQMITVASIVEKEGYLPRNMPQVARVIYNRLAAGTPLQMDSTVLYSLGQDGGTVTPADLKIDTPYNSYLHAGLTPTPICVPSSAALAAAATPPSGQWLFFVVVDKSGTEAFADTYAEQQANEQLAQSRGVG
ncbi:MAG: endolytic transglycosylase MltG [Acidimicrobiales bacterium]